MGKKKDFERLFNELLGIFRTQLGAQRADLDFIKQKLSFVFDPDFTGFAPGEEAALRTSAREDIALGFDTARTQTRQAASILGGREIPSGAQLALQAGLEGQEAVEQASAQRDITVLGGQRRLGAIFSAASILQGNASLLDPLGFANAALGAGQLRVQARGNPLLQAILGGVFGAGGTALSGLTGGLFCWIAEELYGIIAAMSVRQYLLTHASPQFLAWYRTNGQALATQARTNMSLRWLLHAYFDPIKEAADAQARSTGGRADSL